ncbi:MAG: HsdR family type I site-specific deoxyribonuclease [Anaerolineaceae bacterium]|nr:HsdR family type I site-specific deoxyribonuclease [Anaerolineaceae bacterium]
MTRITEQKDVQDALIHYLRGIGWTYLPPLDVVEMRGRDEKQPFLPGVLRDQLIKLNPGLVTEQNVGEIIRRLSLVQSDLRGNEDYVNALRNRWTVYDRQEKREKNLILIDYDQPGSNKLQFTQELWAAGYDRRRLDMFLWINGLPIVLIENKSPTVSGADIQAFEQVQLTYTEKIPDFVKFPPIMVAAAKGINYGPTWNKDPKALNTWKVDGKNYGLENLCQTFFDPQQILNLIRDYTIFFREDDQIKKFILRPHQMRSVRKILERVIANDNDARTGLHWHTQGSGKTLTMIVAAHVLRRELSALQKNPTILIIVDRLELESQMVQNLEAFGFPAVEQAKNKKHLRELLKSGYRGLIVTLIHKFDRMPKDILIRENIVVLTDEAHRSQEGDLGTYMRAAMPNAFYFGFTGTPIDKGKIGRGTFETFGKVDKPYGYQDKYGIDESIEDKTTVPLYYTLAPVDMRVDRQTLEEEFNEIVEREGAASIDAVNAILRKADKLNAVMKSPERVAKIAEHVTRHYQQNVLPLGFKAFLVAIDREGCALYKKELDKHLPPEWSRVVYTATHKDNDLLSEHHLDKDEEKRIRKIFRKKDQDPRILIVTEKLLTGYDAPVLYAMYLDKPLKDHTLLQAIARVNRPYPEKSSGLIIDYVGIFENLQRALSFDTETVATGLINLDELKKHFAALFESVQRLLAAIDLSDDPGRSGRIIEFFADDQEVRDDFTAKFKSLQNAYEVLSPDAFLYEYLDDYALIAQVYRVVYNQFNPEGERRRIEYQILEKTDSLIRENVEVYGTIEALPLYPVDKNLAKVIEADNVSDRVKVMNLERSIQTYVEENQDTQLYLLSIGQEVEEIINQLKERQISAEVALEKLIGKNDQIVQAREEKEKSPLEEEAYALYFVLKSQGVEKPEETAVAVTTLLKQHSGWTHNERLEQNVHQKIYPILRPVMPSSAVSDLVKVARDVLKVARMVVQ